MRRLFLSRPLYARTAGPAPTGAESRCARVVRSFCAPHALLTQACSRCAPKATAAAKLRMTNAASVPRQHLEARPLPFRARGSSLGGLGPIPETVYGAGGP